MTITDEKFTKAFENKIINVHPALIPSFCGKGYYPVCTCTSGFGTRREGLRRDSTLCKRGVRRRPVILQKAVPVEQGDTPNAAAPHYGAGHGGRFCREAVSLFCAGKLSVNGSIVTIKE